jgi:hypothetical protein
METKDNIKGKNFMETKDNIKGKNFMETKKGKLNFKNL